jgi:hypothetical protein
MTLKLKGQPYEQEKGRCRRNTVTNFGDGTVLDLTSHLIQSIRGLSEDVNEIYFCYFTEPDDSIDP